MNLEDQIFDALYGPQPDTPDPDYGNGDEAGLIDDVRKEISRRLVVAVKEIIKSGVVTTTVGEMGADSEGHKLKDPTTVGSIESFTK